MKNTNIRFIIITIVLTLFSVIGKAQKTSSGIYIVDTITKVPIANAVVQTIDLAFSVKADENGFIHFNVLPKGTKEVLISCMGYETKKVRLPSEEFNEIIIDLKEKVASLNEVTVSTSSNSSLNVISDVDIKLRPINNSQEVLRIVPGLFIGQHAGGGKAEQIFLRGFDIDHGTDINLSVDGMPVNMVSHAHGQGYADLHFVIPELIDKVNFNKGPYQADKGNFTTAGFVEFKTKNFLENNFVKMELGQFNTYRGILGLNLLKPNKTKRNQSLYFAGEGSFTKGYFDSPQDFSRYNGLLKYHGRLNDYNTLTASLSSFISKWNASGQIPDRAIESGLVGFYGAIDSTEGGLTSRHNANVELLTRFKNGAAIRNQMFFSNYNFELYSNFTFFKEDSVNGDQIRQKEARNILGYNGSYSKDFYLGEIRMETKAGAQVRYDLINDVELTRTINRSINSEDIMFGDVKELNTGLYFQQKLYFSSKFDVTGGLRSDYFNNIYNDKLTGKLLNTTSTIISPKLNFNFKPNDKVQLYFNNGKGFHSNDTRVAVLQNGKKVLPPAYGSDIGGVFKIGNKLVVQSAFWYLWLDQEFVYVGDEGVVEAGGQTQRFGSDLSIRWEIIKNLFADLDVTLAKPRALGVDKSESYLALAPTFTSIGGITYRGKSGFSGSLRYRFMDDRPANEFNSVVAKKYFVADAMINYKANKWELGLSVQNVLNTKWKETQFDTESKLKNESEPVSEIHFTPGTPFFARLNCTIYF